MKAVKKGTASPGILAKELRKGPGWGDWALYFIFWVVGSQCVGGKTCDGIYRRMAEHKVYVCLKTSVKSISGLRGKSRRKRLKTGRSCHLGSLTLWIHAAFRIFIVVDVLCLQDRDGGTEGAFPTPLDRIPSPRSSFFICRYGSAIPDPINTKAATQKPYP